MDIQRPNAPGRQRDKLVLRPPSWCIWTRSKSHRKEHDRRCVKKVSITRGLAAVVMSSDVSLGTLLSFHDHHGAQ